MSTATMRFFFCANSMIWSASPISRHIRIRARMNVSTEHARSDQRDFDCGFHLEPAWPGFVELECAARVTRAQLLLTGWRQAHGIPHLLASPGHFIFSERIRGALE